MSYRPTAARRFSAGILHPAFRIRSSYNPPSGPKLRSYRPTNSSHVIRVARAAEVLERVGGGDAAEPAARFQAGLRAMPFMKPPRNASPTPVGSTMRAAARRARRRVSADVSIDEPCSPRVTTRIPACSRRACSPSAGLLPDQLELVVVADDAAPPREPVAQLGAAHPRALLARVEDERDAQRAALLGVLQHGRRIVRRDDRDVARRPIVAERQLARVRHRAGVERRDLVVVDVGAAEERCRELARHVAPPATCRRRPPRATAGSRRKSCPAVAISRGRSPSSASV